MRHLPAGEISVSSARWFTAACSVGFILCTLLFLPNWLPLLFSVPVLCFLCGYSLAKRFTHAAHAWLGIALSLSPLCVWMAIRGPASAMVWNDWWPPLVLALGIAAWVTGFDIIYACQDAEYDAGEGLHSVPAQIRHSGALRLAMVAFLHVSGTVRPTLCLTTSRLGVDLSQWDGRCCDHGDPSAFIGESN